jgi:DNA-binding XRE family transcriptional regulator
MTAVIRQGSDRVELVQPAGASRPKPPPAPQGAPEPVAGLLELRADPLGSDIRILFATEPADTITLLAVLEGPEAASEHSGQAITLAGELLTEIRDDGWPADMDEIALADSAEFLARFFPADEGGIARRAGVLAAMTSLARLRADLQLTIEEVAARSGLPRHRVAAIERDGLRTARVHEVVALARALGARLDLGGDSGPVAG